VGVQVPPPTLQVRECFRAEQGADSARLLELVPSACHSESTGVPSLYLSGSGYRFSVPDFPSRKARQLRRVLEREPLAYSAATGTGGSHTKLMSANGYPELLFAFHDGQTLPPGLVRKILVKDVGLTPEAALALL
jgi:predicted RNA binding protein YcfA (HicA-like mRNA interferase family)